MNGARQGKQRLSWLLGLAFTPLAALGLDISYGLDEPARQASSRWQALREPRPAWADLAPPQSLILQTRRGRHWVALHPAKNGAYRIGWRGQQQLRVVARLTSPVPTAHTAYYRMWLEAYDVAWAAVDWNDPWRGGGRDFSHLSAGQHRLWVSAQLKGGRAPQLLGPVMLEVTAAPWLRWWAWPAYAALLLGLWTRQQRRLAARRARLLVLTHELNTPLVAVTGMSELLLMTPLVGEQRRWVASIRQAGEFMHRLLGDMVSLHEARSDCARLCCAPFDPAVLCRELSSWLAGRAQAKGLHLDCQLAADLPQRLYGDALRIRQILLNLLGNALKFTQHGKVELLSHWHAGDWFVQVRDTGPGIPHCQQRHIFKPFIRLDASAGSVAGMGLGLAISRAWVSRMGGSIRVMANGSGRRRCADCGAPAHGSCMQLRLPLAVSANGIVG